MMTRRRLKRRRVSFSSAQRLKTIRRTKLPLDLHSAKLQFTGNCNRPGVRDKRMKNRLFPRITVALLSTLLVVSFARAAFAQNPQMKDDIEQLAMDLHVAMDRSSMNPQQKAQMRDDVRELREAHQNHETFRMMRAARSIKAMTGYFQPGDRERIKQDIDQIKEVREDRPGGGMM
jgi:hypothetical protein